MPTLSDHSRAAFIAAGSVVTMPPVEITQGITIDPGYLHAAVASYLETALWATDRELLPDPEDPVDIEWLTVADFTPEAEQDARVTVLDFIVMVAEDGALATTVPAATLGGDLWLTRNHCGGGFWDRGLGLLGEILTTAAQSLGSAEVVLTGDDNDELTIV